MDRSSGHWDGEGTRFVRCPVERRKRGKIRTEESADRGSRPLALFLRWVIDRVSSTLSSSRSCSSAGALCIYAEFTLRLVAGIVGAWFARACRTRRVCWVWIDAYDAGKKAKRKKIASRERERAREGQRLLRRLRMSARARARGFSAWRGVTEQATKNARRKCCFLTARTGCKNPKRDAAFSTLPAKYGRFLGEEGCENSWQRRRRDLERRKETRRI